MVQQATYPNAAVHRGPLGALLRVLGVPPGIMRIPPLERPHLLLVKYLALVGPLYLLRVHRARLAPLVLIVLLRL